MHHHRTGTSLIELVVGLLLIGLSLVAWVAVLRRVKRQPGGSARWVVNDRRLGLPVMFLVVGVILLAKGISGL